MARKEKKYHFIYKTTNIINGKYYYGMHSTDNLEDDYMGSGKRLRRSLIKYGVENHKREILEFLPNRIELAKRESEIINLNEIAKENCMNLKTGGTGGLYGLSEETIQNIRNGSTNFLKRKWSEIDYRTKISKLSSERMKEHHKNGKINYNTFSGKNHSDETISKMKSSRKGMGIGENNSQFGTCWINKNGFNKKIKKEDILIYINDNWIKGRVL